MYPSPSNFREPAPMSAWFPVLIGSDQFVYAFQYDSLLRAFQTKARELLPVAYFFDREQGRCPTSVTELAATAWGANFRRRDALTVDGVFGPETADALGYLLCATGQGDLARQWATVLQTPNSAIPIEFLRQMFWFAQFVREVGAAGEPDVVASVPLANVGTPPNPVLPLQNQQVVSNPLDRTFVTGWRPAVEQTPVAPSTAAANAGASGSNQNPSGTPAPEPRVSALAAVLAVAGAGVAGFLARKWFFAPRSK